MSATRPAERVDRDVLDAMLAELRAIRQLLEGSRKPTLRRADREQDVWLLQAVVGAIPDCVLLIGVVMAPCRDV
ncbi:MAG: hypothetical protein ABIS06_00050 [Vicinamibacterales bacterium]